MRNGFVCAIRRNLYFRDIVANAWTQPQRLDNEQALSIKIC
jgi:hypothetical protein